MPKKQNILVIVGPTSSGKSALAVELARKFNGEVISADSRQVYKRLNIGTGKITKREMKGVRHHLISEVGPRRIFTAADFVERGRGAIENITSRGKLPIIAGGTGFYIDALLGRVALPNVPANRKLRARLEQKTAKQLLALLEKKDPRRARVIDPHNKHHLIRALEIVSAIGHVPQNLDLRNPKYADNIDLRDRYDVLWIGLTLQSKVIKEKIRARLLVRMRQGMIAEARRLHQVGLAYRRMEQLGLEYRALARYLQGKTSRAQMIDKLDRDIRHYAKRQLTYWKRNKKIQWLDPYGTSRIFKLVRNWIEP